jgi:hypothetical protein
VAARTLNIARQACKTQTSYKENKGGKGQTSGGGVREISAGLWVSSTRPAAEAARHILNGYRCIVCTSRQQSQKPARVHAQHQVRTAAGSGQRAAGRSQGAGGSRRHSQQESGGAMRTSAMGIRFEGRLSSHRLRRRVATIVIGAASGRGDRGGGSRARARERERGNRETRDQKSNRKFDVCIKSVSVETRNDSHHKRTRSR